MAKGRMLNKDTCESDSFAALKDSNSQLLCCLLTMWWDDHGKMIGDPVWIKGNIVRKLKQFTHEEISRCLQNINDNLDVQWWQDAAGNWWLYWSKFDKHQTISQDKKTKDKLPSPLPKNPQESPEIPKKLPSQVEVEVEDKYNPPPSAALKAALNDINKDNFNIYALINRVKKELKWPPARQFPEEVLLAVCEAYQQDKAAIKDLWPWFKRVLADKSREFFAKQNISEAQKLKKSAFSLKEIMAMAQEAK